MNVQQLATTSLPFPSLPRPVTYRLHVYRTVFRNALSPTCAAPEIGMCTLAPCALNACMPLDPAPSHLLRVACHVPCATCHVPRATCAPALPGRGALMSWHVSRLQPQATWRPPSRVPGTYAQLYGGYDEDEEDVAYGEPEFKCNIGMRVSVR